MKIGQDRLREELGDVVMQAVRSYQLSTRGAIAVQSIRRVKNNTEVTTSDGHVLSIVVGRYKRD